MKLRNKKTGKKFDLSEDVFIESLDNGRIQVKVILENGNVYYYYDSLAEFNEEWEDYRPKEPLIKDEKIRKAVKVWAEAIGDDLLHIVNNYRIDDSRGYSIEFYNDPFENLEKSYYTIMMLCGEEEE